MNYTHSIDALLKFLKIGVDPSLPDPLKTEGPRVCISRRASARDLHTLAYHREDYEKVSLHTQEGEFLFWRKIT